MENWSQETMGIVSPEDQWQKENLSSNVNKINGRFLLL